MDNGCFGDLFVHDGIIFNVLSVPKVKNVPAEEFDKFISIHPPKVDVNIRALKYFFKAYVVDQDVRRIIEAKDFQSLQTHPTLPITQFRLVADDYRDVVPAYIQDYINLEQFAAQ